MSVRASLRLEEFEAQRADLLPAHKKFSARRSFCHRLGRERQHSARKICGEKFLPRVGNKPAAFNSP
jgi:hypothetical protein